MLSQTAQNEMGRDLSFAMATMMSNGVMSLYHRYRAEQLLQAHAQPSQASPAPGLDIPFDATVLVCNHIIPPHLCLCVCSAFHADDGVLVMNEQDPMPSVETLVAALMARANGDVVAPAVPLSDVYRSGSMAKHAQ